ncbi:MAG: hypothetical protein FJ267_05255 [Planctomycetes bacterium]|nr:hypothetical protein [Planctomycetota bacterium]
MRIVAFDHFFGQDLDALDGALVEGDTLVRIPYRRWHRAAQKCFPDDAFQELSRPFLGDLSNSWMKFQRFVEDEVSWLIAVHQPNLFVLPSDIFFYVRPFVEAFKRQGVPTFVMQKETTISPDVMEVLSLEVGRYTPFISDFMTVCSQRHKDFWIKAGADADRVTVTGQPRFDVYASPGEGQISGRPRMLYLSYDDVAYLPSDGDTIFSGSWRDMRLETERVLNEFADRYEIIVKEHPQQAKADTAFGGGVDFANRYADTRRLILGADLVVGFQTTALYEATICGKPIIYPAWGHVFDTVRETLCNFEATPGMVNWAQNSESLHAFLENGIEGLRLPSQDALVEALVHLGPIDGNASRRTLELMESFSAPTPHQRPSLLQVGKRLLIGCQTSFFFCAWLLARLFRSRMSIRLARRKNESWGQVVEGFVGLRRFLEEPDGS